jgi:hypothetical protein
MCHGDSKCTDNGNDCCANAARGEPATCAAGYVASRQPRYYANCPNYHCTLIGPPPPSAGEEVDADVATVERVGDGLHCPYTADHNALYGNNQGNQFLTVGGPLQTLFDEEYVRWFQSLLRMPQLQACAVTDAADVLLHPRYGIIRAAYDEDRALWHRVGQPFVELNSRMGVTTRTGDVDEELAFIKAWTRLRWAELTTLLDTLVAQYDARGTQVATLYPVIYPGRLVGSTAVGSKRMVSCGTALEGEVGALCARAGISDHGVCDQGSIYPRCVAAEEAGWDACGCPPGWGWSPTTADCRAGGSTAPAEAEVCGGGAGLGPGGSCTDIEEFSRMLGPLNVACCDDDADCADGSPTNCDAACAAVLLPLLERCRALLAEPANARIRASIQSVAGRCPPQSGPGH